jgi:hypothetical protein
LKTGSRGRWLRRIVQLVLAGFVLLLAVIAALAALSWHCDLRAQNHPPTARPAERQAATANIKDYARPEDDTYLSYPEWYIVWSYQEKADFQQQHLPSGFPYLAAVRQYWNSYCCISRLTRGKYAFNAGEQVMLVVIGSSFSAEYILKGAYEKTLGRLSEWTSGGQMVEEDGYAYRVARDYADFVHIRPFYEFQFARRVPGLWRETRLWGAHPLRKWERKLFLSLDYTVEAFYCWVIEKATHVTYGYEPTETYAWIDNANESLFQQLPRLKSMRQVGPNAFIVDIPRYQEFTSVASALSEKGGRFVEIAGNSQITLSVLAPKSWHYGPSDAEELFSMPVLTHPEMRRVIIGCDVDSLAAVMNALQRNGVTVEHIYDY